ncbi:DMT family transporter [Leifsonia sp. Le1]|uniref:DMT family transporter n=1 Tax=Leifsonia sp. Le1 TaxID=3404918 RepID=UPI003EB6C66B
MFEAVWATALGHSKGLTEPIPVAVFAVGLLISMFGLGWAAKSIPMGTAYSVWVGIGAALTVGFALIAGEEPFSLLRLVFILGIVAAVVGLKLISGRQTPTPGSERTAGQE